MWTGRPYCNAGRWLREATHAAARSAYNPATARFSALPTTGPHPVSASDDPSQLERFSRAYAESSPPWEIGAPQPAFLQAAEQISGDVLDLGCGTGENALLLASRGCRVLGVDFLKLPLRLAREKAEQRGLTVEFRLLDARDLDQLTETFDHAIDSGLMHIFSDEDRATYLQQLAQRLRPGGQLRLLCFSDQEPGTEGPRRVSQDELVAAFTSPWRLDSVQPARFAVRDNDDLPFTPGGAHAWFVTATRV